jgi:hypothetical protein
MILTIIVLSLQLEAAILLSRILIFKKEHAPDPLNQLGFTKGAQTVDHLFTIKTLVDKYKKLNKKLYCTFVDMRKAFDSVNRSALLYKLSCLIGIKGNVFRVIENMYSNSTCQLKMDGKLSTRISVQRGTEQGHTLSPELFKTFMQDLSPLFDIGNCPKLQDRIISHLLWADDLVLIALDKSTLQNQMEILAHYCETWGLEINYSKTNTVIFNDRTFSKNYLSQTPMSIQGQKVKVVEEYTYLGIVLHRNGSFTSSVDALRKKGLRALFGMRRYIDRSAISVKAHLNLFDFLIKPVLSYASPLWTPSLNIVQKITNYFNNSSNVDSSTLLAKLASNFAQNPLESIHLKHLKWIVGSHKKTSNIVTWRSSTN